MIVWDEGDLWAVCAQHRKCTLCRGRLRLPFVIWFPSARDEEAGDYVRDATAFFCDDCCAEMWRGFSSDMRQIKTAKEAERMGFGRAARRTAVSGGFLYTTGTTSKQ